MSQTMPEPQDLTDSARILYDGFRERGLGEQEAVHAALHGAESWTTARARVASLSRSRTADDPALLDARRDLRAARAEKYVRQLVEEAPPLTAAQRDRLALLLTGRPVTSAPPVLSDEDRQRAAREVQRLAGLERARRRAREALSCLMCGRAPEQHGQAEHAWEPKP